MDEQLHNLFSVLIAILTAIVTLYPATRKILDKRIKRLIYRYTRHGKVFVIALIAITVLSISNIFLSKRISAKQDRVLKEKDSINQQKIISNDSQNKEELVLELKKYALQTTELLANYNLKVDSAGNRIESLLTDSTYLQNENAFKLCVIKRGDLIEFTLCPRSVHTQKISDVYLYLSSNKKGERTTVSLANINEAFRIKNLSTNSIIDIYSIDLIIQDFERGRFKFKPDFLNIEWRDAEGKLHIKSWAYLQFENVINDFKTKGYTQVREKNTFTNEYCVE